MTARQAWVTGLLIAGALTGCGAREDSVELVSPNQAVDGAKGRRCMYTVEADEIPQFDDLVRIGTRGNLSLWRWGAEPGDSVELSIRYDDEGRLTWVQTLHSTMEPDRVRELERLVRSAIEEDGPEDWGVRLRFVAGDVDAVLPSVICEPVYRLNALPLGGPIGTSQEMAELYSALGRRFDVEVALDEMGRVMDARLPYSSGSRLLDQYVLDLARGSRYDPKLHDGIGVPSVLSVPVRFRRGI